MDLATLIQSANSTCLRCKATVSMIKRQGIRRATLWLSERAGADVASVMTALTTLLVV